MTGLIKAIRTITIILALLVLSLAGVQFLKSKNHKAHSSGQGVALPLAEYSNVAPFSLTDQTGATVTLDDLKGQIWVANFIFTRCTGPCPLMSMRMAEIVDAFEEPNLKFISFSVDPEYDTPEILKAYSKKYKADPTRWKFLTGDSKKVYDLILESFKLAVEMQEDPSIPIGDRLNHSLHFVVVDENGMIRGYYNGYDKERLVTLRQDIQELLKP